MHWLQLTIYNVHTNKIVWVNARRIKTMKDWVTNDRQHYTIIDMGKKDQVYVTETVNEIMERIPDESTN